MKTTLKAISLIIAFSALCVSQVSAQALYPQTAYAGACVNLSSNLSQGMRSAAVTELQTFLVGQNFPGSGTWMETGFYGAATVAAVKDFQQEASLPTTGVADALTRAAISRISCNGALTLPSYTYPTTSITPAYPTYTEPNYTGTIPWTAYNQGYPYNTGGLVSLNLTSLSQNTGAVGQQVTIYGTGFDPSDNTITFGSVALTGVPSDGNSLTFTVPAYTTSGSVNITVTDSRGTSNALSFGVNAYGYGCGTSYFSAYGSSCGCTSSYVSPYSTGYPYGTTGNCGNTNPAGDVLTPAITYVSPLSGGVGTSVTIYGTGFTTSDNTVHFGNGIIIDLGSSDGQSVSFTVPAQLTGYGSQNVGLGLYNVSVTNGDGFSTGVVPFTVTSLGNNGGTASITNENGPSSLATGSVGTWTVTLSNPNDNLVTVTPNWGDSNLNNIYPYENGSSNPQTTYAQGTVTLTFTHVYSVSGTYNVSFTVSGVNGTQTSGAQSVVVTGSNQYGNGIPSVSYLSPNAGYVGTQVAIYGSNFASNDTIMFGNGAIMNAYSQNGTSIVFTVPSSVGPYCVSGNACPQYLISVTPGTYDVSVMDQSGTSNTIPFTVQ